MSDSKFDVIVIGAGPGGYVCAIRAAQLGLKTACVESRETLGGTCLNVGCIPSKALLESSHLYHKAQHEFAEHGIKTGKVSADVKKMISRKDDVVDKITQGVEGLFKKNKVTWLKGHGSFASQNSVKVTDKGGKETVYEAKNIVIATGSAPIEIPPAKFDGSSIIDSTDALTLEKAPKTLGVIGGGVIGLEMGSVWARLGSKVIVIEAMDKILGAMDKGASAALEKIMKKQLDVEFHKKTMLTKAEKVKGGVKLTCKQGNDEVTFEVEKVLVSVGRRPYTDKLDLEKAGVDMDERGRVKVNHDLVTNVENVWAIGDVVVGPMLAHKAEEEGIAVAERIAGQVGHVNYEAIPNVVYTWPEVASVGMSEEECKEKGIKAKKGQFFFKANGRAMAVGDSDGFVKVLADPDTDRMLGVHIIGASASELIGEVAVAFEYSASAEDLARSVHAHPTLAEAIKEAALAVDKRQIHS